MSQPIGKVPPGRIRTRFRDNVMLEEMGIQENWEATAQYREKWRGIKIA